MAHALLIRLAAYLVHPRLFVFGRIYYTDLVEEQEKQWTLQSLPHFGHVRRLFLGFTILSGKGLYHASQGGSWADLHHESLKGVNTALKSRLGPMMVGEYLVALLERQDQPHSRPSEHPISESVEHYLVWLLFRGLSDSIYWAIACSLRIIGGLTYMMSFKRFKRSEMKRKETVVYKPLVIRTGAS